MSKSGISTDKKLRAANVTQLVRNGVQFVFGYCCNPRTTRNKDLLLFEQQATRPKGVGVHRYGLACDITESVHGEPSWKDSFTFLRSLPRKHRLIRGGGWGEPDKPHSFIDDDHVQRVTPARQTELFASTWYPDRDYNPNKD